MRISFSEKEIRSSLFRPEPARARLARLGGNIVLFLAAIAAATALALLFRAWNFNEANYIMTYLVAVVFVAYMAPGIVYTLLAAAASVLSFNFFFTEPYYSLQAYRPDYAVTFAVMLLVGVFTGGVTARAKGLKIAAELRESQLLFLYNAIRNILAADNVNQIAKTAAEDLARFVDASILIAVGGEDGNIRFKHLAGEHHFDGPGEADACAEALRSHAAELPGEDDFAAGQAYFLPIRQQKRTLGAIGICFPQTRRRNRDLFFLLGAFTAQIFLALERERLYQSHEKVNVEMEGERLRANLLRSISHDLRTPLTGIIGSAGALRDNFGGLDETTRNRLVDGILDEAEWLAQLVENTLYITRLDEKRIEPDREAHPVEELVASAVERIRKRAGAKTVLVSVPDDLVMVNVDATLLVQALVNLLDNAIRHSPTGGEVRLRVEREDGQVAFSVEDRGEGLPEDAIPRIFDRFYTVERTSSVRMRKKGIGLGLTICKSIVDAHGGTIRARNNPGGGAAFSFLLPEEKGGGA